MIKPSSASPYPEIRDEYPNGREGLTTIIRQSREKDIAAYIHVNNRLEGNAPERSDES